MGPLLGALLLVGLLAANGSSGLAAAGAYPGQTRIASYALSVETLSRRFDELPVGSSLAHRG